MIWYDMSYNQFEPDFLNRLEVEPEENQAKGVTDEFNETDSCVFDCNRRILRAGRTIYS